MQGGTYGGLRAEPVSSLNVVDSATRTVSRPPAWDAINRGMASAGKPRKGQDT